VKVGRHVPDNFLQTCSNSWQGRIRGRQSMWTQVNANLWVVAFAGLMFGVGWLVVRWLMARGRAEYRQQAEKLERISSLSLHDAAAHAMSLLSHGQFVRYLESPIADSGSLKALAPELRKLLGRYNRIELVQEPHASITRSSLGPSANKPGFLRIGYMSPATDVEAELGVRPGEETIYVLYADEAPDPTFGSYRSIHHWLLAMAEEMTENQKTDPTER
jgi:hypothetical protein